MSDMFNAPAASGQFTAVPRSQDYQDSLNELLARADPESVPSGILHRSPITLQSMGRVDGTQSFALTQDQWEQHYDDLRGGIVSGSDLGEALPELSAMKAKAAAHAAEGTVPIGVFNLRHHYPRKPLVAAVVTAARRDREIRVPADPGALLAERRAFAASALLPDRFENFWPLPRRHAGLRPRFVLDPDLYVSNTGERGDGVEADFDDGLGLRPLPAGVPVGVSYQQAGRKRIRLVQSTSGGPLEASFVLDVEPAAAVQPDTTFNVTATIPYQGQCNSGIAYVLYGTTNGVKHTQLVNPIMISEGFPGGYSWDYLYGMLNAQNTLTTLLAKGYDVVVLTYGQPGANGGSDFIQRSAFVAVACIQQVIQRRAGSAPLVVGGASMGGVITRYALAYMEAHNLPHQARLFFSFDSPQQGANVPVSVQFFVQALATFNAKAKPLAALLSSPAAQQMLTYYLPSYTYSGTLTSQLHTAFYTELAGLGYPKIKTVGIADGAGNGVKTIPDGAHVIDWYGNICAYGDTWAETPSGKIASIYAEPLSFWKQFYWTMTSGTNYDGAPGGTSPANQQLAQQLIDSDYGWVTHNYDINCFIPTVSALDISGVTPYTPVPAQGAASAFGTYFVSSANNAHVLITPEILTFLLAQLGSPAPAPAPAPLADERDALIAPMAGTYAQMAELSADPGASATIDVVISSDGSTACALCWDGVYVFSQASGAWALETKLAQPYSRAVGVNGDGTVIAVTTYTSSETSTVTVFSGENWTQAAALPLPELREFQIPCSLAVSPDGTLIAAGFPDASRSGPGQVVLFRVADGAWAQAAILTGSDASEALFGDSVAMDATGALLVVGGITVSAYGWSYGGFAYAFSGDEWSVKSALPAPTTGIYPYYGASVAVSGDASTIVVACVGEYRPPNAIVPGTLFVFTGKNFTQRIAIPNPNTDGLDLFASPTLAHDGSRLVASVTGESGQAAYVFAPSGASWTLADTLPLPAAAASAPTGGLAASGDISTIVVADGHMGVYALTGSGWTQATLLATPVDTGGLDFGAAIAIADGGNLVLVGAPGEGSMTGCGYVYGVSGAAWKQLEQVTSPVAASMEQFAGAVALSGNADTVVFGARGDGGGAGCAYVLSGYQWSQQTRLTAAQPAAGDDFGAVVAASDDGSVLVIGVPGAAGNAGAVDVFSGGDWSQRVRLVAASGQPGDSLGASVAISADGRTIVAGAPGASGGGGTALVFSGSNWSQQTTLTPSGSPGDASFGAAVGLSDDGIVAAVGAPGANGGAGCQYVFSGSQWSQQSTIDLSASAGDGVGAAVAVAGDGSAILIGAPGANDRAGAAYLASGSGYGNVLAITASDGQPGDWFGDEVALDQHGDMAVIAAPGRGYAAGAVYVFAHSTMQRTRPAVRLARPHAGLELPAGPGSLPGLAALRDALSALTPASEHAEETLLRQREPVGAVADPQDGDGHRI